MPRLEEKGTVDFDTILRRTLLFLSFVIPPNELEMSLVQ